MQRKVYFAAAMLKTNVHIAPTKYQPDQYVHCDATRDEVFAAIAKQPDLVLFDSFVFAEQYAQNNYYASKALDQNGLFEHEKIRRSDNAELIRIYGDNTVMKTTTMPVIYSYESDIHAADLGPSARYKDGSATYGNTVKPENKDRLKLSHAQMGPMLYYSDQSLQEGQSKVPVVNVLDHDKLTRRLDIPVIGSILRKFL